MGPLETFPAPSSIRIVLPACFPVSRIEPTTITAERLQQAPDFRRQFTGITSWRRELLISYSIPRHFRLNHLNAKVGMDKQDQHLRPFRVELACLYRHVVAFSSHNLLYLFPSHNLLYHITLHQREYKMSATITSPTETAYTTLFVPIAHPIRWRKPTSDH